MRPTIMRKFMVALATIVALSLPVTAQTMDPSSFEVLKAVIPAHSEANFQVRLTALPAHAGADLRSLARDAVRVALHEDSPFVPHLRDAAVRLLFAALVLEIDQSGADRLWAETNDFTRLNPQDLIALEHATGYPAPEDSVRYLLRRRPSIDVRSGGGEYTAFTLRWSETEVELVELSSVEILGLGPVPSRRVLLANETLAPASAGERGSTRRYNLSALGPTVLAAKAFRISEQLVDPTLRLYARIVGAMAFRAASSADVDRYAFSVWTLFTQLEREANLHRGQNDFMVQLAGQLKNMSASLAFFARDFEIALETYRTIAESNSAPRAKRLLGEWGQGITLLAMRQDSAGFDALARSANLATLEDQAHVYMLDALGHVVEVPEAHRDTFEWIKKMRRLIQVPTSDQITYDRDLRRILRISGRTDIAVRYLLWRLDSTAKQDTGLELSLLRSLAAFVRDLGYHISFELDSRGEWKPRPVSGYPVELDFLHNLMEDGRLSPAGVVIQTPDNPYGMTTPEEDIALLYAAYGLTGIPLERQLLPLGSQASESPTGLQLGEWAEAALTRHTAAASIVPYLKLIWFEWFALSFEPLKRSGITPREFVYAPFSFSGKTSYPDILNRLREHTRDASYRELLDLFTELREFLQSRYPPK